MGYETAKHVNFNMEICWITQASGQQLVAYPGVCKMNQLKYTKGLLLHRGWVNSSLRGYTNNLSGYQWRSFFINTQQNTADQTLLMI